MCVDKASRLAMTEQAAAILSQLTLKEKIDLMVGCYHSDALREAWRQTQNFSYYPYPSNGNDRLAIPPIQFSDGPRGAVCGVGRSTSFPATVCRGATFDTELEQEIGAAIGRELRAYGVNLFGGVCVNLPYNPGWGRSQDSYGEDTFAIGQLGAALVRGVQSECVMACVKHFALNSMEYSRDKVNIQCSPRAEQEVFLPQFKDCIDAGAACVMGALNRYQGDLCCESRYLLRQVLKDEWDFDGFVISDWFTALSDTGKAIHAGLDLEMPTPKYYGAALLEQVRKKQVPEALIDDAALRIIRTVLAFEIGWQRSHRHYSREIIGCKAHANLALRAAREGITLLKNDGVLPLSKAATRQIAVLGKLAPNDNLGDMSSGRVFPAHTVTPLDGISQMLPKSEIIHYGGSNLYHARHLATEADAAIVVVGYDHKDEGERLTPRTSPEYGRSIGGDREDLRLRPEDEALIRAVCEGNPKTVVVIIGGGTIVPTDWLDRVPALLMAYYPGQEGGTALAEILFGKVNPSGKLPFVIPQQQEDLPLVNWHTDSQYYEDHHGYVRLDKTHIAPRFPYGFGLSYTTFAVSDASFHLEDGQLIGSCTVANTGTLAGDTVIQLYVGFDHSRLDRPHKLLRGFARVSLQAGARTQVTVCCPTEKLRYFDAETRQFVLEAMTYDLWIGTSSADEDLLCGSITI